MKKFFLLFFALIFTTQKASAAPQPTYLEEVQGFGYLAGEGLACDASKYHTFEMIARTFLISKARSDSEQAKGMDAYNEAKANAFIVKMKDGLNDCDFIAQNFDNQKIFKTVIYGDGTLKMPDGKIIKPRHAYDVTLVYTKDPEMREKMIKMYHETHNKILNDPKYQQALRERQAQEGF
jgi:hypothetical protein